MSKARIPKRSRQGISKDRAIKRGRESERRKKK
jgi:hypothetical protein